MSDSVKAYDLNQVAVSFLAVPLDGGYGDGAAIKFEKTKPDIDTKEGADGSVAFFKTNSKLWKITLTMLSTSSNNAKLSAMRTLDDQQLNGAGIGPLAIADLGGANVFLSPTARIMQWPNLDLQAEPTNVEWVIWAADAVPFWGGN